MEYIENLVSVVIPTHNRKNLIGRAVESAIRQTYPNIEIIVVSDGSDDGTEDLMAEYESKYPNLEFISYFPGKGGNYARNTGIRNSRGEFVAFLDDDDEWHEDKIQRQIEMITKDPELGLICTAMNAVDDATGNTSVFVPKAPRDCSTAILKHNLIGSTITVLVRHNLLDQVGGFDEKLNAKQDYDLWIRLCQITKIGVVTTPCVEYHNLATNNQISWNYEKYEAASAYMYEKYLPLLLSKLSQPELKNIRKRDYLSVARKALKTNDRKAVRVYARKAFKEKANLNSLVYFAASVFPINVVRKVRNFLR